MLDARSTDHAGPTEGNDAQGKAADGIADLNVDTVSKNAAEPVLQCVRMFRPSAKTRDNADDALTVVHDTVMTIRTLYAMMKRPREDKIHGHR